MSTNPILLYPGHVGDRQYRMTAAMSGDKLERGAGNQGWTCEADLRGAWWFGRRRGSVNGEECGQEVSARECRLAAESTGSDSIERTLHRSLATTEDSSCRQQAAARTQTLRSKQVRLRTRHQVLRRRRRRCNHCMSRLEEA